jgi:hypothetical protein
MIGNPLLLPDEGYNISRSVRFRSSANAYFGRTFSASGTTATFSAWVKRGSLSGSVQAILSTSNGVSTAYGIEFTSGNNLTFYSYLTAFQLNLITTQVFRDPSAWYHIVCVQDTTQATASNRAKIYVNGVEVTSFSTATYPSQNTSLTIGSSQAIGLGVTGNVGGQNLDGYLTEVNFIDGQALTPSSFGETDILTGVWKPKKYAGTYGTNGFYLNFSDPSASTATTIGKDYSGNGNNWAPTNISVTAGSTYDSMLDVPTLWADGGNGRGNYCTLNPLNTGNATVSQGNLNTFAGSATVGTAIIPSTIGMDSGKFYFEAVVASLSGSGGGALYGLGVLPASFTQSSSSSNLLGDSGKGWGYFQAPAGVVSGNPAKRTGGTSTAVGTGTLSSGDVFMCAVDISNGYIWFGKNGTWAEGSPSAGTTPSFTGLTGPVVPALANYYDASNSCNLAGNFGQRPFSYTPPTGFKALNTQNLPEPVIKKGNQWMDVSLYTGNAGSITVTNAGFQPDLVWIKARSSAFDNKLVDAVRGASGGIYYDLSSNSTGAESLPGAGVNGLTSTGFTIGGGTNNGYNGNGTTFAAWQWKEGATPGFDIVTYTGDGTSPRNISHSLGAVPAMVIVKSRGATSSWIVKHKSLSSNNVLFLEATNAQLSPSNGYVQDLSSSSTFGVVNGGGGVANVNTNGTAYVAYLFADVAGFSKFGSYTGNGSTDGPFVFTGFRPRWVMVKYYSGSGANHWWIWDTARNTYNAMNDTLVANLSVSEQSPLPIDVTANGFKFRTSNGEMNGSGTSYIYMAFAENPFKYALAR